MLPLLTWLGRNYTITTRRIVLRGGLCVRTRQELLHSRGYDVTVRKAGLQLLFGSGDVRINTGLEHPVVLRDVPGADLVQAALHDLMERSLNPIAARRQQEQSRPARRRRRIAADAERVSRRALGRGSTSVSGSGNTRGLAARRGAGRTPRAGRA